RVQNDLARIELAGALAFEDHAARRTVFHGAARIGPLRLRVELHLWIARRKTTQPDQRRVTDQVYEFDRPGERLSCRAARGMRRVFRSVSCVQFHRVMYVWRVPSVPNSLLS